LDFAWFICTAYTALMLPNADVMCENAITVVETSEQHALDPVVLTALIYVESRWISNVVSSSGACGLTQVLPQYSSGTHRRFGKKLTCRELKNPTLSIQRGAHIFNYWLYTYARGNLRYALCGYNKGFRCKKKTKFRKVGMRYAQRVLKITRKLRRKMRHIYESENGE